MHPVSVGLNVVILVNLPAVFQPTLDHIGLCQVSVLIYVLCAFISYQFMQFYEKILFFH